MFDSVRDMEVPTHNTIHKVRTLAEGVGGSSSGIS